MTPERAQTILNDAAREAGTGEVYTLEEAARLTAFLTRLAEIALPVALARASPSPDGGVASGPGLGGQSPSASAGALHTDGDGVNGGGSQPPPAGRDPPSTGPPQRVSESDTFRTRPSPKVPNVAPNPDSKSALTCRESLFA